MPKAISPAYRFCLSIVLLVSFAGAGSANAQKANDDLPKLSIDGSRVVAETAFKTIEKLAYAYKLRVGFEERPDDTPAKGKFGKAKDQIAGFRGSLDEFLNRVLQVEARYAWTYRDGVIRIFPAPQRDPKVVQILDTQVKEFSFPTMGGVMGAGNTICETPEVAAKLTDLGMTPIHFFQNNEWRRSSGKPPVKLADKKVSELLDELLRYNDATIWTISRWGGPENLLTITLR